MPAVIPMRPDIDAEQRTKDRALGVIERFTVRLRELRRGNRKAKEFSLPLPWYAHEGSPELELIVAHFKPKWRDIQLRRAWDSLHLVFVK